MTQGKGHPKGTNPAMPLSGLSTGLPPPQQAKNFAWADWHWAINSTFHANVHVELLNLLPPDAFPEAKSLQRSPDALAGLKGREGPGKGQGRGKKG